MIGAVLGYPLYYLVRMSFQRFGLKELVDHKGEWIGTTTTSQIFHDREFWDVVVRTLGFTVGEGRADDGARDADRAALG